MARVYGRVDMVFEFIYIPHISHERLRTSDPPRRRLGAARAAHSSITITEGPKRPKFDSMRLRRVSPRDGLSAGPA